MRAAKHSQRDQCAPRTPLSRVRSHAVLLTAGTLVFLPGCSTLDLKRFAPPGLIKYENIADEAPVNPNIDETIARHRQNGDARYPSLGDGPSTRPEKLSAQEQAAQMDALRLARDAVNGELALINAAAEADEAAIADLTLRRAEIDADIQRLDKILKAETRTKIAAPDQPQ